MHKPPCVMTTLPGPLYEAKCGFVAHTERAHIPVVCGALDQQAQTAEVRARYEYYERKTSIYTGQPVFFGEAQTEPLSVWSDLTEQGDLPYVNGWCLKTGSPAKLPACKVFQWTPPGFGRPTQVVDATGLACADMADQAINHAYMEIVERDNNYNIWTHGPDSCGARLLHTFLGDIDVVIGRSLASLGMTTHILHRIDGMLHFTLAITSNSAGNATVGSAARLCPLRAIEVAILESIILQRSASLGVQSATAIGHNASLLHVIANYLDSRQLSERLLQPRLPAISLAEVKSYSITRQQLRQQRLFDTEAQLYVAHLPSVFKGIQVVRVVAPNRRTLCRVDSLEDVISVRKNAKITAIPVVRLHPFG